MTYGLARAGFGLVKKMAIADQFAPVANAYFASPAAHPGALAAWSAVFAFGMQIYFDFSGYSDIAIGCARLFGFVFPENFSMPYLATSITDFWHRWHITLSTWLRDYLYIPLGGNRGGTLATLRNLMLTMLLGGLWHGAQWTFVAWGAFHGVMLCAERLLGIGHGRAAPRGVVALVRIAVTFAIVSLGWVLFRSPTFATRDRGLSRARRRGRRRLSADRMAGGARRGHRRVRRAAPDLRAIRHRSLLAADAAGLAGRHARRRAADARVADVVGSIPDLHLLQVLKLTMSCIWRSSSSDRASRSRCPSVRRW